MKLVDGNLKLLKERIAKNGHNEEYLTVVEFLENSFEIERKMTDFATFLLDRIPIASPPDPHRLIQFSGDYIPGNIGTAHLGADFKEQCKKWDEYYKTHRYAIPQMKEVGNYRFDCEVEVKDLDELMKDPEEGKVKNE